MCEHACSGVQLTSLEQKRLEKRERYLAHYRETREYKVVKIIFDNEARIIGPSTPPSSPKACPYTGHRKWDSLTGKHRQKIKEWYAYIMQSPSLMELVIMKLTDRN